MWESINDGTIFSCPSLLSSFIVVCFADLKKYKFTYLFGFPTLHYEPTWQLISPRVEGSSHSRDDSIHTRSIIQMAKTEMAALTDSVQSWRFKVDSRQHGFFLAKRYKFVPTAFEGICNDNANRSTGQDALDNNMTTRWEVASLSDYEAGFFQDTAEEDNFVAFADPSTYPEYPGWMLRNLLVLIRVRWKINKVQILCYRDPDKHRNSTSSVVFPIEVSSKITYEISASEILDMPRVTGWERNGAGKVVSRVANLGEFMDPQR